MDGGFDLAEDCVGRTPAWEPCQGCQKIVVKLSVPGERGRVKGQNDKLQTIMHGLISQAVFFQLGFLLAGMQCQWLFP